MGPFPQVHGQVKEWLILELREMIKGPNIVACPILFFSRGKENWIALSYAKWYFSTVIIHFLMIYGISWRRSSCILSRSGHYFL